MKVQIIGRHINVTEALKDYTNEKAGKLIKFYDRIHDVKVIMGVDGDRHTVEMSAGANRGVTLVAQVAHEDLYAAIGLVVDKMERQLRRYKEKLRNHKGRKRERERIEGERLEEELEEPPPEKS